MKVCFLFHSKLIELSAPLSMPAKAACLRTKKMQSYKFKTAILSKPGAFTWSSAEAF